MTTHNIEGLGNVLSNIEILADPKRTKKAAVKAARKALTIAKKEAVKNARALDNKDSAEKIWKHITVKTKKSKNKGELIMSLGFKGGAKKSNTDVYYWRFLEFGTVNSPAKPFLRPALYNNIDGITTEFVDRLNEDLLKALDV